MWNSTKSLNLSIVCTRIVMILVIACAVMLPKMMEWYRVSQGYGSDGTAPYPEGYTIPFMVTLYLCCLAAMTALICLAKLLRNIKKEEVFIDANVKHLRTLSWCCILVALLFAVSAKYYILFVVASVAAAFIGLILRVVKNVIQQAVLIKAENDYTI